MAEDIDVAKTATSTHVDGTRSIMPRCGMQRDKFRHEFVEDTARGLQTATAPRLRESRVPNCTRLIWATDRALEPYEPVPGELTGTDFTLALN